MTEFDKTVARAAAISDAAVNRPMTASELREVNELISKAESLKAAEQRDKLASMGATSGGFDALARQLVAGGRGAKASVPLSSVLPARRVKTNLTETSDDLLSTRIEAGITPLPYDTRYIFPVFNRAELGTALHVSDFRVTSHAVEIGSGVPTIERDPVATTTKAAADVTVHGYTGDVRQFAVLLKSIPNALLASQSALSGALESELKSMLYAALDAYVSAEILAASIPSTGGTGSSPEARVRNGMDAMRSTGCKADTVVLYPSDATTIDLRTFSDRVTAWPFGLSVVTSADGYSADPLLIDTAKAGVLYLGSLALEADPYSGFEQNTTDLRAEFNGLLVIRNSQAFLKADGS